MISQSILCRKQSTTTMIWSKFSTVCCDFLRKCMEFSSETSVTLQPKPRLLNRRMQIMTKSHSSGSMTEYVVLDSSCWKINESSARGKYLQQFIHSSWSLVSVVYHQVWSLQDFPAHARNDSKATTFSPSRINLVFTRQPSLISTAKSDVRPVLSFAPFVYCWCFETWT